MRQCLPCYRFSCCVMLNEESYKGRDCPCSLMAQISTGSSGPGTGRQGWSTAATDPPAHPCWWGSCSPCSLHQELWEWLETFQKNNSAGFLVSCQFVQMGLDTLHKKSTEWPSPGAPDLKGLKVPLYRPVRHPHFSALGADQDQQILVDVRLKCKFWKQLRASFCIFITRNQLEISISTLFLFN